MTPFPKFSPLTAPGGSGQCFDSARALRFICSPLDTPETALGGVILFPGQQPGSIWVHPGLSPRPGVVDYRNPHLAEAMKVLGYVQRFGVGIQLAQEALRKNGNPPAKFTVEDTFVHVEIGKTV